MKANIEGYPWSGPLKEADDLINQVQKDFATVQKIGPNRFGVEVLPSGLAYILEDQTAEAGSSVSEIVLTGHGLTKAGGFIRFTSGALNGMEVGIKSIIDVDTLELNGILDSDPTGLLFDVLRFVIPRYTEDGASLATITPAPLAFRRDTGTGAVTTQVYEDTVTPANNIPLPVKLVGLTGDINITANDLNVQLSHAGANPDSMQIGDGTEVWQIDVDGAGFVRDVDAKTALDAISAQLPTVLGQNVMANSLSVVIASNQSNLNVDVASSALPTGAATEAKQDTIIAGLASIDANDFATEATLLAISGQLPATLGQKLNAASLAVSLSTEQQSILDSIKTAVELIDNAVAGTEFQVDIVSAGPLLTEATFAAKDFATEATLAALSAKLPAILGQTTKAGSLSVTIASDDVVNVEDAPANGGSAASQTGIDHTTPHTFTAPANAIGFFLMNDPDSGNTLRYRIGAAANATVGIPLIPTDNSGFIPCASDVSIISVSALGTVSASIQWITRT